MNEKEFKKRINEDHKKIAVHFRNVYTNFARMSYEEQMDLIVNWDKSKKHLLPEQGDMPRKGEVSEKKYWKKAEEIRQRLLTKAEELKKAKGK